MDPFTQRMLERAKLRREKLDNQIMELENKPPLQESNTNIKRKSSKSLTDSENVNENKKEKEYITSARKSKLQKLAKFYSSNDENVLLEDDEDSVEVNVRNSPERKQQCKLGRLDELASKIKQWDDDLDHKKPLNNNVKDTKKENNSQPKNGKNEKPTSWDSAMVEKLCSQGFSLSGNHSRLIYDFEGKNEGHNNSSPKEIKKSTESQKNVHPKTTVSTTAKLQNKSDNQAIPASQNEVLKKAALFEVNNKEEPIKRVKDPAELSLAERKALFERNKGEAVLPKNYFVVTGAPERKWPKVSDHQKPPVCTGEKENKANEAVESHLSQPKFQESNRNVSVEPKKEFEKNIALLKRTFSPEKEVSSTSNEKNCSQKKIPQPPPLPNLSFNQTETLPVKDVNTSCNSSSGRLYPSLSNLDITDESEVTSSEIESCNESKNSNFYMNMTLSDLLEVNKNNPTTPPNDLSFSKSKECQVLNNMDKLLEDALNDMSSGNEGEEDDDSAPSPPKMMKSTSFEYKGSNQNTNPLLHTVSFYRKQQQSSCASPEKEEIEEKTNPPASENEDLLVQDKIQMLLTEVSKQQTIISQASQALNLCVSTVEFSGSGEQVEGERLLLLATHKRQACLNEIQRLKVENTLRPQGETLLTERGDVNLTNISLKLKRDALRALAAAENDMYFVCLVKSDEQVLATPVVSATRENLKDLALQFPGSIKLEGLLSNFKITIEVYNLELGKELLPHDVKYHIVNKKEKKLLTPIKCKKSESKLVRPNIQSPGGPSAVRTSNFQMCGYIVFSLREVTRTQWILNKVPYISPLEGTISMNIQSQLRLDDEFRGFLTMFDDISGFGAWHRRWCLLSSHFISYWKYPDDEHKKVPNGTIDLRTVITENVGLVSRDVCARLNTFLLESTRPRLNEDKNSLVLSVNGNVTTIRHLLSADSKQEMMTWCKKLNTTLALLRSWKCNFND